MHLLIKFGEQEQGLRACDALKRWHGFSNQRCKKIKYQGSFLLNGEACKLTTIVNSGDVAEIDDGCENNSDSLSLKSSAADLVIYQNPWFVACNKPATMLTHPNFWDSTNALTTRLSDKELHLVNRLDKDTSGLVLVASTAHAHAIFSQMQLQKYYLLVVHGDVFSQTAGYQYLNQEIQQNTPKNMINPPIGDSNAADLDAANDLNTLIKSNNSNMFNDSNKLDCFGQIAYPIARREGSILERRISKDAGKPSLTYYQKLAYNQELNLSLVLCRLMTGRTHQIRLHFLSLGHPLLGESLYDLSALCEYANLPIAERQVSFKKEITDPLELAKLAALRFADNPLDKTAYQKLVAKLLDIDFSKLSISTIMDAPRFKIMQELNKQYSHQMLHAWCMDFSDPAAFPKDQSSFYRIFASLPADWLILLEHAFNKSLKTLLNYQDQTQCLPIPNELN